MSYEPRYSLWNDVEGRYGYVRGLLVCFNTEKDGHVYLQQMRTDTRIQDDEAPWRVVDMRHPNNVLFLETTKEDHRYLLLSDGQLVEHREDHLGAVTEDDLDDRLKWDDSE
jgi:hypothetical protein